MFACVLSIAIIERPEEVTRWGLREKRGKKMCAFYILYPPASPGTAGEGEGHTCVSDCSSLSRRQSLSLVVASASSVYIAFSNLKINSLRIQAR
jgi:hypothetical protein